MDKYHLQCEPKKAHCRRIEYWRRKWQPTPVFLPGESHGQRSLVGYSPWGRTESDMTEQPSIAHIAYSTIYINLEACKQQGLFRDAYNM